jgi:hypothetical protein
MFSDSKTIPILVVSCDKYSDLWKPFFTIFRKRWSDCPYKVYLGTNHLKYEDHDVTSICVGDDVDWASNLHRMLDQLNSDRVIMFLEDFLLIREVDTEEVQKMVKIAQDNSVDCLRLIPRPRPWGKPICADNLGIIEPGEDYRISTQVALWNVDLLRKIAIPGFSAWDFEVYGTLLSERLPGKYWGVLEAVIDYRHGVERGNWLEQGLEICREAEVRVDLTQRSIMTETERVAMRQRETTTPREVIKGLMPELMRRHLQRWYRSRKLAIMLKIYA